MGYMKETILGMIGWSRSKFHNITYLAKVNKENLPSQMLLEKIGFELKSDNEQLIYMYW